MKKIPTNPWTRREFTAQSVLALMSGITITLTGCGDGNSSSTPSTPSTPTPTPTPTPQPGDVPGAVSANHGHIAVVMAAQINAGNAVTLDITGDADHPHTVQLTAGEIGQIADGMRVQKTTSVDQGHAHVVTFN